MRIMDFTSTRLHKGVYPDWRVLLLTVGDRYGRGGVYEVGVPEIDLDDKRYPAGQRRISQEYANKSRVAFYMYSPGFESDMQGGPEYQFVSDYYLSTLLGIDRGKPLSLAQGGMDRILGYEPAWKLSAEDMVRVFVWLLNIIPEGDPDVSEDLRGELLVQLDQILEGMPTLSSWTDREVV